MTDPTTADTDIREEPRKCVLCDHAHDNPITDAELCAIGLGNVTLAPVDTLTSDELVAIAAALRLTSTQVLRSAAHGIVSYRDAVGTALATKQLAVKVERIASTGGPIVAIPF